MHNESNDDYGFFVDLEHEEFRPSNKKYNHFIESSNCTNNDQLIKNINLVIYVIHAVSCITITYIIYKTISH
jgi:hypothetical protein|uniref:Uncharacterized protein n=1 Tax=viral metagenome TaxID=1070528 RepID=A0A6C0D5L2_9ZZZZ